VATLAEAGGRVKLIGGRARVGSPDSQNRERFLYRKRFKPRFSDADLNQPANGLSTASRENFALAESIVDCHGDWM